MIKYMDKLVIFFLTALLLVSCGGGTNRIKTMVELTSQLSKNATHSLVVDTSKLDYFDTSIFKNKQYGFAKSQIIAEPLVLNGVVFAIDTRGSVQAFSVNDRKLLWSYDIGGTRDANYSSGGISYQDGRLYITNGSRYMIVLDSTTGYEVIRKEFSDIIKIKPVMLGKNVALVQTVSNHIFTVDLTSFNFLWRHEGMPEILTYSYHTAPMIYKDLLIVHYNSGEIFAINAQKGNIAWSIDLSSFTEIGLPNFEANTIICKPVLDGSYLYIATSNGKLLKLNLNNGTIIWKINAEDIHSMSLFGTNLFITNNAKQVASVDVNSGIINFVGDLNSTKQGSSVRTIATSFLDPILAKTDDGFALHVIGTNGELYSFISDSDNKLPSTPSSVTKIPTNARYFDRHKSLLVVDKKIILGN